MGATTATTAVRLDGIAATGKSMELMVCNVA